MAVISHRNLKIKSYQAIIILLLQLVVQENCIKTYILHSSSSLKRSKSHRRTKKYDALGPKSVYSAFVCSLRIFYIFFSRVTAVINKIFLLFYGRVGS